MRAVVISASGLVSELLLDALKAHFEETNSFDSVEAVPQHFAWENCITVFDAGSLPGEAPKVLQVLAGVKHQRTVVMMSTRLDAVAYSGLVGQVSALMPPSSTIAEIVLAARLVASGIVILPTELAARLSKYDVSMPVVTQSLTDREAGVLYLLGFGFSDKKIARELGLHDATARTHVRSVLKKLGMENRTMAALYASRLEPRLGAE